MTPIMEFGKKTITPGKMYYFTYPHDVKAEPTIVILLAVNQRDTKDNLPRGVVMHVENRDNCNDMVGDVWPMEGRLSEFIEYRGKLTLSNE